MDTCYLCVLGGKKVSSPVGRPATTDGFGTCYECAVHACAVHGDKPINKNDFRCADCWSAQIALASLQLRIPSPAVAQGTAGGTSGAAGASTDYGQPPPESEAAQLAALINRFGLDALAAIAPGLGALALDHLDGVNMSRMAGACEWLRAALINRDQRALAILGARLNYGLQNEDVARRSLAWESRELPDSPNGPTAAIIARLRLAIALEFLPGEALDNPAAPRSDLQAALGACAVLMAYASRGTNSLNHGILVVPGALLLRPIVLALGLAYQAQR
jgi:hypothetical protein